MMAAIIGQDWRNKTLTELFIQYQTVLLETWHHTAHIKGSVALSKNSSYSSLHPYYAGRNTSKGIPIPTHGPIMSAIEEEETFMEKMLEGVEYPDDIQNYLS